MRIDKLLDALDNFITVYRLAYGHKFHLYEDAIYFEHRNTGTLIRMQRNDNFIIIDIWLYNGDIYFKEIFDNIKGLKYSVFDTYREGIEHRYNIRIKNSSKHYKQCENWFLNLYELIEEKK